MLKMQKTEEQLKAGIYTVYSRYLEESSSDRRQVYFAQICGLIISWCNDCLGIKANEMGIEIYNLVQRLVRDKNSTVPKNEDGFFKYLKTALYTAEKEYYRNNETGLINIPRDTRKRLKIIDDIIATKESNAGRKLTQDERRQCISEWFGMAEYSRLISLLETGGLEFSSHTGSNEGEIDILNSKAKPPYRESASIDPLDEYFAKLDLQKIRDTLEQVFQNTQERTRDCYRALFTGYCIDKFIDFEGLVPLLDSEILEAHKKDGKKPKQHEIYLKYHPNVKKDSAEVRASEMIKKLRKDLCSVLQEKIPENYN